MLPSYTTTQYYGNYDKNRWKLAADACRFVMEQRSQYYGLDLSNVDTAEPDSWEKLLSRFINRYFIVGKESVWIAYEKEKLGRSQDPLEHRQSGGWN